MTLPTSDTPHPLWEGGAPHFDPHLGLEPPTLTPYLLGDGKTRGAVIVCPGGGYGGLAAHEGEPIARWLNGAGVSALVLRYRHSPYRHPVPLMDLQRAIRMTRAHAAEWHLDPTRIGILGFSAGGHLVSTGGTMHDAGRAEDPDPVEQQSSRPDALILCYPVISFVEHAHMGSARNLLGEDASEADRSALSTERLVNETTPPSFLWHTASDTGVPVENSLLFSRALSAAGVPFELHVFPEGRHGVGLGADVPGARAWPELAATWLSGLGFDGSVS